ncbi:hypothetical protein ACWCXB_34640 [Streptomyces sp. NPDC001514]
MPSNGTVEKIPSACSVATPGTEGNEGSFPLRNHPLRIAGKDTESDGVYTISGRSLREDVFTSVPLVERTPARDPSAGLAHHSYVVGRRALAGDAALGLASEAAAVAAPAWAEYHWNAVRTWAPGSVRPVLGLAGNAPVDQLRGGLFTGSLDPARGTALAHQTRKETAA